MRVLSQITKNRKVEDRKSLIFQCPIFGFYLKNANLRQSLPSPPHCNPGKAPRSRGGLRSQATISRWREIRACNDNACGESKSQNFHDSLLDLTFLIVATDPKAP